MHGIQIFSARCWISTKSQQNVVFGPASAAVGPKALRGSSASPDLNALMR